MNYFARLALPEQLRFHQALLGTLPEIVLVYDLVAQQNLMVNAGIEQKLGYTEADVAAMGVQALATIIHPEDQAEIPALMQLFRKLQPQETYTHVNRWRHKNGTYRWFFNRVLPFEYDAQNGLRTVLCICEDISAQVENEQAILEQLRHIQEINFTLSHQLNHEHTKVLSILALSQEPTEHSAEDLTIMAQAMQDSTQIISQNIALMGRQLSHLAAALKRISLRMHQNASEQSTTSSATLHSQPGQPQQLA